MLVSVSNKRKEVSGEAKQSILDRGKHPLDNSFLERSPALKFAIVSSRRTSKVARRLIVASFYLKTGCDIGSRRRMPRSPLPGWSGACRREQGSPSNFCERPSTAVRCFERGPFCGVTAGTLVGRELPLSGFPQGAQPTPTSIGSAFAFQRTVGVIGARHAALRLFWSIGLAKARLQSISSKSGNRPCARDCI